MLVQVRSRGAGAPGARGQRKVVGMKIHNRTSVRTPELDELLAEVARHESLADVMRWGFRQPAGTVHPTVIADVVVQDEYSHDVVVPWRDGLVLVYGTT